jgi:mannan endo-1,4-beta-mannosidase
MFPRFRSRIIAVAAAIGLAAGLPAPPGLTAPAPAAAVTKAQLVNYFAGLTGKNWLSGQQDGPNNNPGQWQQKVHDITGEYPGVWGGDFGFSQNDIDSRQKVFDQAKAVWAAGSIPAITWHACAPVVATCQFEGGSWPVKGSHLSDPQWSDLITDGGSLNTAWKRRLDQTVPYFQQLKDAGIPVLFRPQHEMNEGWAWWGGRPGADGSRKLFQLTHDYLVGKGFDNIVWVWNVKDVAGGAAQVSQYYPGDEYVDLATLDVWVEYFPTNEWYQAMQNVSHGKPIALAEVGRTPTPAQMAAQNKWTYFSVWIDWLIKPEYNTNQGIKNTYYDPRVLNRGEITIPGGSTPQPRTGQITGIGGKCIDVAGASTTNGTAVQLWDCNGSTAQRWTIGTDNTIRALGKCLDVTGQGTGNGTKIQLWDCNGSGAQQWQQNGNQLRNPQSGRNLDVPGGSTTNGTRLQIWDANTNAWQQWTLPVGTSSCTRTAAPGERTVSVPYGGQNYPVTVYVPAGASPTTKLPMVMNLHGTQGTGTGQLSYSDMKPAADAGQYLVMAPTGVIAASSGYAWNVPGVGTPPAGARDDVGFLSTALDVVGAQLCADTTRLYGTGYSGGGRMLSAFACARPERLAAIAPVAGLRAGRPDPADTTRPDPASCQPTSAVPVVAFHGQQDNTNPYNGGGTELWRYSVPTAQQRWATINGCTATPTTTQVATHVVKTTYPGCRDSGEVSLYSVSDGGHTWPGSPYESTGNGKTTREISANTLMWQFFQRYHR